MWSPLTHSLGKRDNPHQWTRKPRTTWLSIGCSCFVFHRSIIRCSLWTEKIFNSTNKKFIATILIVNFAVQRVSRPLPWNDSDQRMISSEWKRYGEQISTMNFQKTSSFVAIIGFHFSFLSHLHAEWFIQNGDFFMAKDELWSRAPELLEL